MWLEAPSFRPEKREEAVQAWLPAPRVAGGVGVRGGLCCSVLAPRSSAPLLLASQPSAPALAFPSLAPARSPARPPARRRTHSGAASASSPEPLLRPGRAGGVRLAGSAGKADVVARGHRLLIINHWSRRLVPCAP